MEAPLPGATEDDAPRNPLAAPPEEAEPVNARRVLAEARREAARAVALRAPLAAVALAALLAFFAAIEIQVEGYTGFLYLVAPLLFLPVGARAATRDRESGAAAVLATTPLTAAEALAAKLACLTGLVVASVAATLPTTAAVVSRMGDGALPAALEWVAWGVLVGVVAAATGLLIGHLFPGRTVPALSAAFLLGIAWFALPASAESLVSLADTDAGRHALVRLLHVSPLAWAGGALGQFHPYRAAAGSPGAVWGVALLGAAAVALLAAVALRMQHAEGWLPALPRSDGLPAVVATLLVVAIALNAWGLAAAADPGQGGHSTHAPGFNARADVEGPRGEHDFAIGEGERIAMRVHLSGPANLTIRFTDVSLTHPAVAFAHQGPAAYNATLEYEQTLPNGRAVGDAELLIPFQMAPHRWPAAGELWVNLTMRANGETIHLTSIFWGDHAIPPVATTAAATASMGALALLAAALPRRLNRW